MSNRFVRSLSRTVDNMVLLTLLVILMIAAWSLYDTHQLFEESDSKQFATYKPTVDDTMSFDELRVMNPDVIGWITIYGTKIDYPMVCSPKSNNDYLSKNAKGEWSSQGSIFLDHKNASDFSDFNTILYGHHMAQHAMFGDLDLFLGRDFFNSHEYGSLFYNNQSHGLFLFAMLSVDAYDRTLYAPAITGEVEKAEYIHYIKENAMYWRGDDVTTNDHIVLMSTCSADITNGRFVLVGKILPYEVENQYAEVEEEESTLEKIDIFNLYDKFSELPLWAWIAILIALIIITFLLYRLALKRAKKKYEKKREKRLKAEKANEKTQ